MSAISIDSLTPVSRRRGALINLFFNNYGMVVVSIISGIVLVPLYLKHISVALYGAWFAATNIISYLTVVDAGLNIVVSQRMAQAFGGKDLSRMGGLFGTGILLSLCQASVIWLFGFGVSPYIAQWVNLSPEYSQALISAFRISVVTAGLYVLAYAFAGAVQVLQRFALSGCFNLAGGVLNIVSVIFLLRHGYALKSIAIGGLVQVLVVLLGNAVYMLYLWKSVLKIRIRPNKEIFREIAHTTGYTFVGKIFGVLASNSDALVAANLMGPHNSAILTLTGRAASLVETIVHRISSSTLLGLAHLSGNAVVARVREVVLLLLKIIILMVSIGIGGYIAFNRDFVSLWVGPSLYGGGLLVVLLGISVAMSVLFQAFGTLLTAIGEIRLPALVSPLSSIVRVLLLVLIVSKYGLIGAPLASILSLLASLPIPWKLFRKLEISRPEVLGFLRAAALQFIAISGCVIAWNSLGILSLTWGGFVKNALFFTAFCLLVTYPVNSEFRRLANRLWAKTRYALEN